MQRSPKCPPGIFDGPETLNASVNKMHDMLCNYVQTLSVAQKRTMFHVMTQVATRPDRCAVIVELAPDKMAALPLGSACVYRLLKGTAR